MQAGKLVPLVISTHCALCGVEPSSLHGYKGKHLWMLNVAQVSSSDGQHTPAPATTRIWIANDVLHLGQ